MKIKQNFSTAQLGPSSITHGWGFKELFRTASSRTLTRTLVAVGLAWIPLALLSALRGGDTFLSFLSDYASGSRFLIILPVLILAEPLLRERLALVARHFESDLVPRNQWPEFQASWNSCERLRNSILVRILIAVLTYATAAFLVQYLSPTGAEFVSWWKGSPGFRAFSLAGTWAFFVSYPILAYFTYLWLWRQFLWARFLRSTTRLNLRLVAAHPDTLGGLGFLEASVLGQIPFSFCLGVGLAGAIANRVLHQGLPLMAYRYIAAVMVVGVLLYCVGPYLFFTRILLQMRRDGMLSYGAFAHAVGEQFEKKWLHQTDTLTEEVLLVPDFSTTGDLYSVVHNIDDVRILPIGLVDLYAIVAAALIPAIPVLIAAIPFDVLIKGAMHLLF